jgi:hypothetical protein
MEAVDGGSPAIHSRFGGLIVTGVGDQVPLFCCAVAVLSGLVTCEGATKPIKRLMIAACCSGVAGVACTVPMVRCCLPPVRRRVSPVGSGVPCVGRTVAHVAHY